MATEVPIKTDSTTERDKTLMAIQDRVLWLQAEADAAPVRLIVRRVKPTPGSQLALFAKYSYHGFITSVTAPGWRYR